MWISPNEGAKFWLSVLTEIHNRGVKDILIACVDGLTGFPNAIETVFPKTQVQLCIVHMVRNSVSFLLQLCPKFKYTGALIQILPHSKALL
jgi:putative transposase